MSQEQADPIWAAIRAEAVEDARIEPMLASFLHSVVLNHKTLEDALSFQLAGKLESHTLTAVTLRDLIDEAIQNDAGIREAFRADILAVLERDPACTKYSTPLLYLKGFHALQGYRVDGAGRLVELVLGGLPPPARRGHPGGAYLPARRKRGHRLGYRREAQAGFGAELGLRRPAASRKRLAHERLVHLLHPLGSSSVHVRSTSY